MSKIEDALNKARRYEEQKITGKSLMDHNPSKLEERKLGVVTDNTISAERYKSSTEQIALMGEDTLFDKQKLSDLKLIFSDMDDKEVANKYRDLRTTILQKSKGQNVIIMITSCVDGADSRTTALNLATAFSFDESKTSLFIDCKLHNLKNESVLNIKYKEGLTDYLVNDEVNVDSIIYKSGINRLRVIPAGTSREVSTEFFTSMRMRELMSQLLSRYSDRYIFIDADPIAFTADTKILVDLCDYVALSVPYGRVTRKRLLDSVSVIDKEKFLGVIFTDKPKLPRFKFSNIKIPNFKLLANLKNIKIPNFKFLANLKNKNYK